MKKLITIVISLATVIFAGSALAQDSIGHGGKSLSHFAQSIQHSAEAVGHGFVSGAKLTSGVISTPFKVVGAFSTAGGHMSNAAGEELWDAASGQPFEITDENFTKFTLPPHEAIKD